MSTCRIITFLWEKVLESFKVLLGCLLEQPALEQGAVPLIRAYVTTVSVVNNLSFFTCLSKGTTNCYLQSELLFATRQHRFNNTTL